LEMTLAPGRNQGPTVCARRQALHTRRFHGISIAQEVDVSFTCGRA
jgi:hypothetical protein